MHSTSGEVEREQNILKEINEFQYYNRHYSRDQK